MFLKIFLFLVVAAVTASAQNDAFDIKQDMLATEIDKPNQFCGRRLNQVMRIICQPQFDELFQDNKTRFKRGILEECCKRECTLRDVRVYCPNRKG